jgi:hypothetical protein
MPDLYPSLPKLPFTYQQWLQQTSKTLRPRSPRQVALDILVDAYIRTPSGNNLRYLKNGFRNWCEAQGAGDAWMKAKRNDPASLPYVSLNAALNKDGDTDAALNVPSFMQADLVSTRLGLLYMFGRLECDRDYFKIVTTGVLDMAGAGLDYGNDVGSDGAKEVIGNVKTGMGVVRPGFDSAAERLDDARKGSATRRTLPSGSRDVGIMEMEQMRTVDARRLLGAPKPSLNPNDKRTSDALYEQFRRAWEFTVGVWDEHAGSALRQLCDFLTGRYLSEAIAGTIGGSFGVASNLIKLIESSFERYRVWATGKKTQVLLGTPTAIVDGIKRAIDLAVASDLYATLKSGAQLGMQIASVGASTLVNLVSSIIEILIKTAWRLFEIHRLRKFFAEAQQKWESRDTEQLHTHPIAFNRWFRGYALGTPMIAALALNSGICNKMHFLQMFPDGKAPINQAQYDAGAVHIAGLKNWSSSYIEESGYHLHSTDGLIMEWIKPSQREAETSVRRHLLNPIIGFFEGGG